eukprot:3649122-Prymnesium_polylepis.1
MAPGRKRVATDPLERAVGVMIVHLVVHGSSPADEVAGQSLVTLPRVSASGRHFERAPTRTGSEGSKSERSVGEDEVGLVSARPKGSADGLGDAAVLPVPDGLLGVLALRNGVGEGGRRSNSRRGRSQRGRDRRRGLRSDRRLRWASWRQRKSGLVGVLSDGGGGLNGLLEVGGARQSRTGEARRRPLWRGSSSSAADTWQFLESSKCPCRGRAPPPQLQRERRACIEVFEGPPASARIQACTTAWFASAKGCRACIERSAHEPPRTEIPGR